MAWHGVAFNLTLMTAHQMKYILADYGIRINLYILT